MIDNPIKLTTDELLQIYDVKHGLICRFCQTKVLDPDKTKHQIYIKDRCPVCRLDPDEEAFRLKEQRKAEKRARKQAKRNTKNHLLRK